MVRVVTRLARVGQPQNLNDASPGGKYHLAAVGTFNDVFSQTFVLNCTNTV